MRGVARAAALAAAFALLSGFNPFVRRNPDVRAGAEAYEGERYDEALGAFEAAEGDVGARPEVHLDKGTALYKLGRFEDAAREFQQALGAADPALKARGYHNLGNTQLQTGAPQDAIDSYRKALLLDPGLDDAKVNLELARAMLAEQEQSQSQSQQKDEEKSEDSEEREDESQPESSQSQDEKDSTDRPQQARQDEPQPQPGGGEGRDEPPSSEMPQTQPNDESAPAETRSAEAREGEMSREEAERLLDSLERRDVNLLHWSQMVDAQKRRRAPVEKDW